MGRPAAFLDRDGVLNIDRGHVGSVDRLDLVAGAGAAVARLNRDGYFVAVVTNQSGIGRGHFTQADYRAVMDELARRLASDGGHWDDSRMCPYLPNAPVAAYAHPNHPWRKPNPGMILDLIAAHGLDPARSFLIGDRASDIVAAKAAGVCGHLFEDASRGAQLDAFLAQVL